MADRTGAVSQLDNVRAAATGDSHGKWNGYAPDKNYSESERAAYDDARDRSYRATHEGTLAGLGHWVLGD